MAVCPRPSGGRLGAAFRSPKHASRGLHIAHPVSNASSEDGSVVEDHRLAGRHGCLGPLETKGEPSALQGDAARGRSVGMPDLGVGPLGEIRNEETYLAAAASCFVSKDSPFEELFRAIEAVTANESE